MTSWNTKMPLRALRVALLTGIGVVAFSAAANAVDLSGDNLGITGNASIEGDSAFGSTGQTTIDANGNATVGGTLGVTGATTTSGISNTGNIQTTTFDTSGAATIGGALAVTGASAFGSAGQTTIDANGNGSFGGTLTATGKSSLNGGLAVTGGTTTDSLIVIGASTTNGIANTGALTQNGKATFSNGLGGGTTTISGGTATFSNGSTLGAGVTTINAGTVTTNTVSVPSATGVGGTTINSSGVTVGATTTIDSATGTVTVNVHGAPANQTVLGGQTGDVAVGNNFVVKNTGVNVDLGDNVVHGVAAPVFGTDAANKAYVDSGLNAANRRIDKAYQGTAIALALSQPIFAPGQSWAVRAGWGGFEGQNAGGVSVAGIIGRDWFGAGTTVAVDGGVGFADNVVAGKAGVTIGFGGGYTSLK